MSQSCELPESQISDSQVFSQIGYDLEKSSWISEGYTFVLKLFKAVLRRTVTDSEAVSSACARSSVDFGVYTDNRKRLAELGALTLAQCPSVARNALLTLFAPLLSPLFDGPTVTVFEVSLLKAFYDIFRMTSCLEIPVLPLLVIPSVFTRQQSSY